MILGGGITFFYGAPNLAKHLKEILQEKELLERNEGKVEFIDSQNLGNKKERFYEILKEVYRNEDNKK